MADEKPVRTQVNVRFEELRTALGLTQQKFAETSGDLQRVEVNKLESGLNQATAYRTVRAIAVVVGVCSDDVGDYLSGELSLEELLRRRGRLVRRAPETSVRPEPEPGSMSLTRKRLGLPSGVTKAPPARRKTK